MANACTWARLNDGSWGLRGFGIDRGMRVTVTRANGSTSAQIVGEIVHGRDGVYLARLGTEAEAAAYDEWVAQAEYNVLYGEDSDGEGPEVDAERAFWDGARETERFNSGMYGAI